MKKLIVMMLLAFVVTPAFAESRSFELGADLVVPYRTDSPSGRLAILGGGHGELFFNDSTSVTFAALFGIENNGFTDNPVYLVPGVALYLPFPILNPYLHADVPVLINNGQDIGIQGGAGVLWNILLGLGLKYSIDVAYYFDSNATVVNWAHIGAVFTF